MPLYLRPYREQAGLSAYRAAKKLGVTYPSYFNWETGKTMPTADKLPALAELFGCTIDELFTGGHTSPDATILSENGGGNHGA